MQDVTVIFVTDVLVRGFYLNFQGEIHYYGNRCLEAFS